MWASIFYSILFGIVWLGVFVFVAMLPEWAQDLRTDDIPHDVAHAWGWLGMSAGFTAAIFLDAVIDRTMCHLNDKDSSHPLNLRTILGGLRLLSLILLAVLAISIGVLVLYYGKDKDWIDGIEKVIWCHMLVGCITKSLWLFQKPYHLNKLES